MVSFIYFISETDNNSFRYAPIEASPPHDLLSVACAS